MHSKSLTLLLFIILISIVACKTNKELHTVKEEDKELSKLIIEIQPDYTPMEIVNDYAKYELENKSKVSKQLNAFLFTYNSKLIDEDGLLSLLHSDSNVIKARGMNYNSENEAHSIKKLGKKSLKAVK